MTTGKYLIGVGFTQLEILDLSAPAAPRVIGAVAAGPVTALAARGNWVYVGTGPAFQIFDISDPANPKRVARLDLNGHAFGIAVSGDHVFVALVKGGVKRVGFHGLVVVDVKDFANPRIVESANPDGEFLAVTVSESLLYAAGYWSSDGTGGIQVFDLQAAPRLERAGVFELGSEPWNMVSKVVISGDRAYLPILADNWAPLIFELSDRRNPQWIGRLPGNEPAPQALAAENGRIYVSNPESFKVFELAPPAKTQVVPRGSFPEWAGVDLFFQDVEISGNYAFMAADNRLAVVDISRPEKPRLVDVDGTVRFYRLRKP